MSSYHVQAAASPALTTSPWRAQVVGRAIAIGLVALMMMLLAQWIWQNASPLGFNDDAAQTLSTASQWQQGQGLTTTVLYYDSQLEQVSPAAQTVWPPALAVSTAMISDVTGLSLSKALLALLLFSHLVTAIGIGLVAALSWRGALNQGSLRWWIGLAALSFWLVNGPAVLGVARGLSEPLYLAFAMLALLALQLAVSADETPVWQGKRRRYWPCLFAASLAVTAALLTRYQAVVLIVPLMMAASMVSAPGTAASARIKMALAVAVMPLLTLAGLFWRNWTLSGALTGGASASSGQSLTEMAARMNWLPTAWQQLVMWALIGSMLLAGLVALVLWARGFNSCRSAPARLDRRLRTGLVFSLSVYAGNLALLVLLGLMSTVYSLELRYLTLNMLFLMLPATAVLQLIGKQDFWRPIRLVRNARSLKSPTGILAALIALTLLQIFAFKPVVEARLAEAPPAQIAKILSTPSIMVGDTDQSISPVAWLASQASPPNILSANAQSLSLALRALDVPVGTVLGLPLPIFTDETRGTQQIYALASRQSVNLVMGFRQVPTWVYPDPLDSWIDESGKHSARLESIGDTPALFLGRIHHAVNSSLCGPSGSDKLPNDCRSTLRLTDRVNQS